MDEKRFNKVLAFIVYMVTLVMAYIFAITFCKVPDTSKDLANISLGFLLGNVLGVCIGYLVVGNPDKKKQDLPANTTEKSITVSETKPIEP